MPSINGFKISSINLLSPDATPAIIPITIDKKSPIMTLEILLKTLFQK